MPNQTKGGKREIKVKAWAITRKNKIIAIEFGKSKPTRYTIGTWQFFIEDWNSVNAIPCKITYQVPSSVKK
jgi:hypothetical protein